MKKVISTLLVAAILCGALLSGCSLDEITGKGGGDTLYMVASWETVGMKNHSNGGASIGTLLYFAIEPLIQYVRSTDEIYFMLAESVEHLSDGTSLIHLRPEAKWHNGDDYVAMDTVAYYYLNQLQATNYMQAVEAVDDKTVKITWKKHMEPNDKVKNLILATDNVGCVQYKEFKEYADKIMDIVARAPAMEEGYTGWAPFGKVVRDELETEAMQNYSAFAGYNPDWFVATGPYKPYQITATDMILEKNEDYWAADYLKYQYIHAYQSITDNNQVYGMLINGTLTYGGGIPTESTLQEILSQNKDLVHMKCYDPGACGLLFNLAKTVEVDGEERLLFDDTVREAFQYIFDRDSIAYVANQYSVVTYRPMLAMAPADAKRYMSEEAWNKIRVYSHNEEQAAELLRQAGWTKQGGSWYGADGEKLSFTLHYDGSNEHQARSAEATATQLNNFGIETKLKSSSSWNDWFGSAQSPVWGAELSLNWTDLNMSFSYPTGSYVYAFSDVTFKVLHLPKYPSEGDEGYEDIPVADRGQISVILPSADGKSTFRLIDRMQGLYSLPDAELTRAVDDLCYGVSTQNWGVPFYQSTCGFFINTSVVDDLPRQDLIAKDRNVTYVPTLEDGEDFFDFGKLNLAFSYAVTLIDWDAMEKGEK